MQILRLRDKLGSNYTRLFEKAFNDFENSKKLQYNTVQPAMTAINASNINQQNTNVDQTDSQSSSSVIFLYF